MKKFVCILMIFVLTLPLCACRKTEYEGSLEAMDTFMTFKVHGADADYSIELIKEQIKELDKRFSTTDKNSEIYALNSNGKAELSGDTVELLSRSLELCGEAEGALDISVYPIVQEWGFISGDYKVPSQYTVSELLTKVDYKKIKVDNNSAVLGNGMKIDLGAVAKGYAADKCREILESESSESALLNLGGTIVTYGAKPDGTDWNVAITDPDNSSSYFGYLSCRDVTVATSGGYERYFEKNGKKYIHIIDPETGSPVNNGIKSVTVVSKDGTRADALSTALYVMGKDKAVEFYREHKDFDFIIACDDNKMYISGSISDSFKLSDGYDYEIIKV